MRNKLVLAVTLFLVAFSAIACAGTIQADKSIKEVRSSSAETGPVVVTAVIRKNDGAPLGKREFHLITIARDDQGGLKEVQQLLSVTGETDSNGNLKFEVPRDKIASAKEFSFGMNSSNPYGPPLIIRRKDAKEFLSFRADDKTKRIDLGDVIIPLG